MWHWYEGEPLELLLAAPDWSAVRGRRLGVVGPGTEPLLTVPAGWWQAARPLGEFALCGCTVAPGFEFEDFVFLRDDPAACEAMRTAAPAFAALL